MPHYNILIGCDQLYYDEWGIKCLESIQQFAPWANLHCHIVNPANVNHIPGVSYTYEEKDFYSSEHKSAYLQAVRFIVVPQLFKNDDYVMTIDCDTLCCREFTPAEFESVASNVTVLHNNKSGRWLAGAVTYGLGEFRNDFAEALLADDEVFWEYGRDQQVLKKLVNKYNFTKLPYEWMQIGKLRKGVIFFTLKGDQKVTEKYVEHYADMVDYIGTDKNRKVVHFHLDDAVNKNQLSNPFRYFATDFATEYVLSSNIKKDSITDAHVVLSGAIYLDDPKVAEKVLNLSNNSDNRSLTIWNGTFRTIQSNVYKNFPHFKNLNSLSFTDNIDNKKWVPCVSCMHKVFDKEYNTTHGLVAVLDHTSDFRLKIKAPTMFDNEELKNVIHLIGSGETLITNSYYGVYWGLLLGRRVLVVNCTNPAIDYLPIPFIRSSNRFYKDIKTFEKNNSILGMCREKNTLFWRNLRERILTNNY